MLNQPHEIGRFISGSSPRHRSPSSISQSRATYSGAWRRWLLAAPELEEDWAFRAPMRQRASRRVLKTLQSARNAAILEAMGWRRMARRAA